jgi:hypothetical protein
MILMPAAPPSVKTLAGRPSPLGPAFTSTLTPPEQTPWSVNRPSASARALTPLD